ncbi:MAG: efflux RND transporter periplasmic adaptor subunit [Sphingobacteriaceae bacterium]|nr:efflux RND transporter periplasmic adaptor subunit [Sphingobacteriaceae bacterium]MBK7817993.1 efflux RND transporter periplasmic adaptor subunit [Sphingobacteriaceae bacterium]
MKKLFIIPFLFLFACKDKVERTKPTEESISESIYASGIAKSKNQYQAFAIVNGIIENIFVTEGDSVKKGDPILSISNETQKLNKENAELAAQFADVNANQGKLNEVKQLIDLSRNKMKNDSALYFRQKNLWQDQIGTKVELENRELAYQNSKNAYYSSLVRYDDLKRQIEFNSQQSKKNLMISSKLEGDFTLRSEIDGIIYSLPKSKGEIVGLQTPLAVIGDASNFVLEMQVDEFDILKIKKGLPVLITLDSYKGRVFEAKVTKIDPLMNERSKTFLVEAEFIQKPEVLYPNITFEANIVLQTKEKALLVPRNYLIGDSMIIKANGDKVLVKTGLKDYKKIEILSGLSANDEIIKPTE